MSDYSIYPNAIDGYSQLPTIVDGITQVNARSVNTLRSAIINIETELGIAPSGSFYSVSARMDNISSSQSDIQSDVQDLTSNLGELTLKVDEHIINEENPHQIGFNNLIGGTLGSLNSLITDATLDNSTDSRTPLSHHTSHEAGSSDTIDGDILGISFVPTNYTPDTTPTEVTSTSQLTAHLKGIDNKCVPLAQVITVAKSGGDYTTIEDGLAEAALIIAGGNRCLIEIYPGDYYENNPLIVPNTCSINCHGRHETTQMFCLNTGAGVHGIICAIDSEIIGLKVQNASGSNASGFYIGPTIYNCMLHDTKIKDCYIGWLSESTVFSPGIIIREPYVNEGTCTSIFKTINGGQMNIENARVLASVSCNNAWHVDGLNSTMRVLSSRLNGTGAVYAIRSENLGTIEATSVTINYSQNGIIIPASGGVVSMQACAIYSDTLDLTLADTANVICELFGCVLDSGKFSIGASAQISGYGQDINSLSPGPMILGELWLGADSTERVPLSSYSRGTFLTGLISGGEVEFSALGGPLDLDINTGSGFINTGTGVKKIIWDLTTIPTSINTDFYIYVNSSGVVSNSSTPASTNTNITLASGRSGASGVLYISKDVIILSHSHLNIHNWISINVGLLWLSGLETTVFAGLQVAVSSGSFSRPDETVTIVGGSPITMLRWYRDPIVGWKHTIGDVDDGFYDDGSGTLAAIPGGTPWKKDAIYVTKNGSEIFHYFYSQSTYIDQVTAEAASLPIPPNQFQTGSLAFLLSGSVVNLNAGTIATFTDELRTLGVSGVGSGSPATDHGSLAGLGDDDHNRYVDLSGNAGRNSFTGTLDASNGSIILPANATPSQTTEGSVVWDNNDDLLTIGTGVSRKIMVDTNSNQNLAGKTLTTPVISSYIDFIPIAPITSSEGRTYYDSSDHCLAYGTSDGSTIQVNQEEIIRCLNNSGVQINDGQAVYISGSSSSRPEISLANASSSLTSDSVIGLATQNIGDTLQGFVTSHGLVRNIDTTGGLESWIAGDVLWLSTTSGGLTNVRPISPNHVIRIGYALLINATLGVIFVDIDVYPHLTELCDVKISAVLDGDVLTYENATSLWKNIAPPIASEILAGKIEIATQIEVTTGTDDTKAITPLKLASKLSSIAGLVNSHVISLSASFNINSVTPTTVFGMFWTPTVGTWDIRWEGEVYSNGNAISSCQFYKDAVAIGSIRRRNRSNNTYGYSENFVQVTVTGTEIISLRMAITSSNINVYGRSLSFTKVNVV